jgi:hypothetical protein
MLALLALFGEAADAVGSLAGVAARLPGCRTQPGNVIRQVLGSMAPEPLTDVRSGCLGCWLPAWRDVEAQNLP